MRGILPDNIVTRKWGYIRGRLALTLTKHHSYQPLFVDAVVSNPPYSQNWDLR